MGEVTKLMYLLRCCKCGSNEFYILLSSFKFSDIKSIECVKCGNVTRLEDDE